MLSASKCKNTKKIPCPTFADVRLTIRALTSLDISNNNIGQLVLPEGWTYDSDADSSDDEAELFINEDGRRQKAHPGKPEGVIALANSIKNNGVLTSLNISNNALVGEKGTGKFTEKTYDSDGDTDEEEEEIMEPDFSGVVAIADAIPAMGALTSLNLADNRLYAKGAKYVAKAIKVNVSALPFN